MKRSADLAAGYCRLNHITAVLQSRTAGKHGVRNASVMNRKNGSRIPMSGKDGEHIQGNGTHLPGGSAIIVNTKRLRNTSRKSFADGRELEMSAKSKPAVLSRMRSGMTVLTGNLVLFAEMKKRRLIISSGMKGITGQK